MKTTIKTSLLALAIAIGLASCSGGNSSRPPDTTKTDNASVADSAGTMSGKNGSTAPIDTGIDHSGSGGTDTAKKM
ncbi:hypothetical protein FPZ43_04035 [Mucilaginibacter pallidiroseus]|uniref:Uncharacterized protein n=1 Tax=Mucilaginibacter pallidiroseus TaxID=2599295 RepID=A0A563UK48_9SPHI|nr:hypothetical protein [Mucilaginibacter pallidiroseus]TWR31648.1 hypothetical protein FPZ43_04035 [Mucilaginibacter pallidiroseus]